MVSPALGREGVRGRVAGRVKSALCRDACECVCIVQKQLDVVVRIQSERNERRKRAFSGFREVPCSLKKIREISEIRTEKRVSVRVREVPCSLKKKKRDISVIREISTEKEPSV